MFWLKINLKENISTFDIRVIAIEQLDYELEISIAHRNREQII